MAARGKILVALAVLVAMGDANAKQSQPSLTGLAKAMAAEQHCSTLIATERLELERTTESRRQLESAKSPAIAAQLYADGLATGAKARCDALTARSIKSVLLASRIEATAAASTAVTVQPRQMDTANGTTADAAAAQPAAKPKPAVKPPVLKKPVRAPQPAVSKSLASYGSMVEAYYRELRCPSMSTGEVNAFYRDVMRAHRKAVSDFGAGAAATAVHRAEARASAGPC